MKFNDFIYNYEIFIKFEKKLFNLIFTNPKFIVSSLD